MVQLSTIMHTLDMQGIMNEDVISPHMCLLSISVELACIGCCMMGAVRNLGLSIPEQM